MTLLNPIAQNFRQLVEKLWALFQLPSKQAITRPESMSTVTRDEFETVKELLMSAARYAESANRGLERLEAAQERTQANLDRLSASMGEMSARFELAQNRTQAQLDALTVRVDVVSSRVDAFVSASQHYFTKHGESIEQLKGISENLSGILSYLVRKEQQQ
ncbi:hypothetical protein [Pantanalinema sp. GBBB05]|uniref:hypothetical protein n=1 Tax=Pantanalinema sp. GBBB05 TaxID=2604139 RepID=UPI001D62D3D4|nr:hypothetical protein [Pantanalinema sp. GBBB05]